MRKFRVFWLHFRLSAAASWRERDTKEKRFVSFFLFLAVISIFKTRVFFSFKVQVIAVRCIQRNIRKFMAIRQWPWWRLLTKVLPLVEVTRTEEELREKQVGGSKNCATLKPGK